MKGIKGFQKGHKDFRTPEGIQAGALKNSQLERTQSWRDNIGNSLRGKKYPERSGDLNVSKRLDVRMKISEAKWQGGYEAHLERTRPQREAYNKQWQKDHKELTSFYSKQYLRRKAGAEGAHTLSEWRSLITSYGGRCAGCSEISKLEADHIQPVSKNGTNYVWNIQPMCRSCNARKSAKFVPEEQY